MRISRVNKAMVVCALVLGVTALSACSDQKTNSDEAFGEADLQLLKKMAVASPVTATPHGQKDPHKALTPEKQAMVALGHLQEGRIAEAMQTIGNAIYQYPDSAHLFAVRSQIHASQNNQSAALLDIERAIALKADDPAMYVNRAALYSRFDRDDKAMDDLNTAIELDPNMLAAHFNRGSLLYIQEKYEQALADFEHCIIVDPHTAAPYFNRAAVYEAMGDNELALKDLERFLQLNQDASWAQAAEALKEQWQSANS